MKKLMLLWLGFMFASFTAQAENGGEDPLVIVSIQKFKFIPEVVEIKSGQKIRWVNEEKRQYHSVFFEKQGEKESDYLFPGESLEKSFIEAGAFEYRCGPHPEMVGKVIVK